MGQARRCLRDIANRYSEPAAGAAEEGQLIVILARFLLALLVLVAGVSEAAPTKYVRDEVQGWGQRMAARIGIPGFGRSIAVIVAIGDYRNGWAPLTAPAHDAERMATFLQDEAGFDIIYTLLDEEVTYPALRTLMLQDLHEEVGEQDRVLFYFSGHGTQQTLYGGRMAGYLPLQDSTLEGWGSMIAMDDLKRWWDALSQARQSLFVIDACFSGLGIETKSDRLRRRTIEELDQRGHHIFTAGTANQESYASLSLWGGSLFTTALIDGMRGQADSASPGYPRDGIVTLGELKEYVRKRIRSENLPGPMTPQIVPFAFDAEGEFFFISTDAPPTAQDDQLQADRGFVPSSEKGPGTDLAGLARPEERIAILQPRAPEVRSEVPEDVDGFRDCAICPEMVRLPAGQFEMGSNFGPAVEKPRHSVRIARPFAMGRREITLSEWQSCVAAGACSAKNGQGASFPVTMVTGDDAKAFAAWLSETTGETYRLPTEAEWEYAAAGGRQYRFPTGHVLLPDRAAFGAEADGPSPVASYPANPFGLYDLAGNVWEWVSDCAGTYGAAPSLSISPGRTCDGVLRGGSWRSDEFQLRSANRFFYSRDRARDDFGFRVVRDVAP